MSRRLAKRELAEKLSKIIDDIDLDDIDLDDDDDEEDEDDSE